MSKEELEAFEEAKKFVNGENENYFTRDRLVMLLNFIEKSHKSISVVNEMTNLLDKQVKIIYAMAKMINSHDIDEDICKQMCKDIHCNAYQVTENKCIECIIKFFEDKTNEKNV